MGIIFNRVAGTGHLNYLREAMASLPTLECFGGIPVREETENHRLKGGGFLSV